jgi:hypothetical protein
MRMIALSLLYGAAWMFAPAPAAHAAPVPVDAPVCHAVVGEPPTPGIDIVSFAAVDCAQQPDQLRWVATLQFQPSANHPWFSADFDQLEKTYPLHQSVPLSAKCEEGYWRKQIEIWQRTAGKSWHGLYFSDERIVYKNDCIEHTHIF